VSAGRFPTSASPSLRASLPPRLPPSAPPGILERRRAARSKTGRPFMISLPARGDPEPEEPVLPGADQEICCPGRAGKGTGTRQLITSSSKCGTSGVNYHRFAAPPLRIGTPAGCRGRTLGRLRGRSSAMPNMVGGYPRKGKRELGEMSQSCPVGGAANRLGAAKLAQDRQHTTYGGRMSGRVAHRVFRPP
jgi:hypothetical protein